MDAEIASGVATDGTSKRAFLDIAVAVGSGVILKIVEPLFPTQWGPWPQRITTVLVVSAGLYALYAVFRWASRAFACAVVSDA